MDNYSIFFLIRVQKARARVRFRGKDTHTHAHTIYPPSRYTKNRLKVVQLIPAHYFQLEVRKAREVQRYRGEVNVQPPPIRHAGVEGAIYRCYVVAGVYLLHWFSVQNLPAASTHPPPNMEWLGRSTNPPCTTPADTN